MPRIDSRQQCARDGASLRRSSQRRKVPSRKGDIDGLLESVILSSEAAGGRSEIFGQRRIEKIAQLRIGGLSGASVN